ncbi:MAG: hypothetical protein K9L64_00485 [Candidatus Izimaplasma sp.]|nr:hypothetical protein [Candidatus Izimaplasma bacterium]
MIYIKLLKVFIKENYSLKNIIGSNLNKSKTKTILLVILILYGLGSLLFSFGYLFFSLGEIFHQAGMVDILLTYIFMYATFLSALFVIIRASSYLFHYKDYDLLASLPIKNHYVIAAKLSIMMIMIYLSVFIFTAPIVFSYLYFSGFTIYKLLAIILALFVIPILPIIIFSFFSLLITYITSKFRISKLINVFLMFGLLLAFFYFSFSLSSSTENPLLNQQGLLGEISQYIPTYDLFINSINNKDILALIGLILINLVLLVGFIYGIQNLVHKTNQNETKAIRRNHRKVNSKQRSIVETIVIKEFKKFFSVNIYVLNSGFGAILMLVGGVLSIIYADKVSMYLEQFINLNVPIELLIIILISFLLSTIYTSAISLSLEGKNLWIMKSLPIKAETIMFSKMLFNVLLGLPFAYFFIICLSIGVGFNATQIFLLILFVTSFSLTTSSLGSIINLHFPKFSFKNETEVVKQSAGAFLGMFGGFSLLLVNGLLYYFLYENLSSNLMIFFIGMLNLLLFVLSFIYINKKSESLFMKF